MAPIGAQPAFTTVVVSVIVIWAVWFTLHTLLAYAASRVALYVKGAA